MGKYPLKRKGNYIQNLYTIVIVIREEFIHGLVMRTQTATRKHTQVRINIGNW